ncbi:Eukaryotic Translation Initiation Factor 3 Subunit E [Manis pentadactyla]|nr:Eukaryotic Translation Initiation Factor 3 Subunit E [Manis pentadactyla]
MIDTSSPKLLVFSPPRGAGGGSTWHGTQGPLKYMQSPQQRAASNLTPEKTHSWWLTLIRSAPPRCSKRIICPETDSGIQALTWAESSDSLTG